MRSFRFFSLIEFSESDGGDDVIRRSQWAAICSQVILSAGFVCPPLNARQPGTFGDEGRFLDGTWVTIRRLTSETLQQVN
jgi:hypothetical protein